MKIAVFYNFYPHYRNGIIKLLISEFGDDITFFGASVGEAGIKVSDALGGNFSRMERWRLKSVEYYPGMVSKSVFGGYETHIYLANPNYISTWIAAICSRAVGKRVIFWGHGFMSESKSIKNAIRSLFFRLPNAFLCYNNRSKEISKKILGDKNWHVVYNSLDLSVGHNRRLFSFYKRVSSSNVFNVIAISRLTAACRYDILLRALSIVSGRAGLDVVVTFIGDGPERAHLESMAKALGVNSDFKGAVYDEAILRDFLFEGDVAVSPGKVGLTAVHCMAHGLPVITHSDMDCQMPEVETVVEGVTGHLFEKDSVDDLVRAIEYSMSGGCVRSRSSEACFAMIEKLYTAENQLKVIKRALVGGVPEDKFKSVLNEIAGVVEKSS